MPKKLKLYVWEDVLCDYTAGVMFALAPDVETARTMLRTKNLRENGWALPEEDLAKEPNCYTEPFALTLSGGG